MIDEPRNLLRVSPNGYRRSSHTLVGWVVYLDDIGMLCLCFWNNLTSPEYYSTLAPTLFCQVLLSPGE